MVADSGTGISPEFLPHVFEQFAQAESNLTKNQGMGLGLVICKHLVELHHGSISAESGGLGCGTTIRIELPLMTSESASSFEPLEDKTSTGENTMADTRLRSVKLLAVDDDADTRHLVKVILERSGAHITVAGSGREAFEVIKNTRPDVLICDLGMPEMDGYELLQKVRHLDPEVGNLPAIALTASARNQDRIRTRQAGFQAHLAKPIAPNELIKKIIELVDRSHAGG